MDYSIKKIKKHTDKRGNLVVFLKNSELSKPRREFGQIYFITFSSKGMVRGNHFHKKWREWFGIVDGEVRVELEDVITKKRVSFVISSHQGYYNRLEIGPNIAHAFKSLSPSASLLNYGDKEWSSADSYSYTLISEFTYEKKKH